MKKANKPIKVLWFVNTPSLAGEKFGIDLLASGSWIAAAELEIRKRHDIKLAIAFLMPEIKTEKFIFKGRTYYQIRKEQGKIFRRLQHVSDACATEDLLWAVKDFEPDIIHIYGSEGPFGLIANMVDVPVVLTIQGIAHVLAEVWQHNISQSQMFFNSKLKDLLAGDGMFHEYRLFKMVAKREEEIFKRVRNYIGLNNWDRNQINILANFPIYYHLNSIIRRGFFGREWNKKPAPKFLIVSVASPALYKGFDQILEVAKILVDRKMNFEWKVIGVTAESSLIRFFEKIKRINFASNNVRFLGILDESALIAEFLKSDVYVHPSHIENSSTSVTEAMILGMPVIANFVGGMNDLIKDGRDGILVPDGDSYEMAAKILEIRNNPITARELGSAARILSRKKFDPKGTIDALIAIYEKQSTGVLEANQFAEEA